MPHGTAFTLSFPPLEEDTNQSRMWLICLSPCSTKEVIAARTCNFARSSREAVMKRLILVLTVVVFGSLLLSAQPSSLAHAARQAKADKNTPPAKHVYTADDIAPAPV